MMPLLMTTVMTLAPAGNSRQDHGLHYHRHIGGARHRPHHLGNHPQLSQLALDVPAGAAHLARRTGAGCPAHAERDDAAPRGARWDFGGPLGPGFRRHRLRTEQYRCRRRARNAPRRSLECGRRRVPGRVHLPADLASENRLSAARPAHLRVAQLHRVGAAHGEHDDGAVRHHHPAADLPAERARTQYPANRTVAAAGRSADGLAGSPCRAPVRQSRANPATGSRRHRRQRRAVGDDAARVRPPRSAISSPDMW